MHQVHAGSHLSGIAVTGGLGCDYARSGGPPGCKRTCNSRDILLPVGFTRAHVTVKPRELLPHDFTLSRGQTYARPQPVCFCGTFLRVAPTGRYPAPYPVKPGLSSCTACTRPPGTLHASTTVARSLSPLQVLGSATFESCALPRPESLHHLEQRSAAGWGKSVIRILALSLSTNLSFIKR